MSISEGACGSQSTVRPNANSTPNPILNANTNAEVKGESEKALIYLEEELGDIYLGSSVENKLEARSLELQKVEEKDYEARVDELESVGFRTSRKGSR